jgi:plasmid maintenance system antidote protein VapI
MMDRKPAEVCHPGEHLRDELEARGWCWRICNPIIISGGTARDIMDGKLDITLGIARVLGDVLGTSADYWMGLQRAWDERGG